MKKIIILLCLFIAAPSIAAVISYEKVTTYVGGIAIPAAKLPNIVYIGWYGPSQTGPWTESNRVTDRTEINAPDPMAGMTGWYSVSAVLDGMESAKCVPASKTIPPLTPSSPPGCTVR